MPRKRTKRADGRYQLKRKMPDGSSRFFYGKTITEAQDKYEAACRQVILDEQKQNGGATFREMAQAYRDYITGQGTPIKCSTIKSYKRYLKIFTEHFGDTPMQEIDAQAVCGLMENMKVSGKSLHTITNAKSVLSCVFKFWCANYHGTSDPVLLAAPPAGMKRGRRDEPTAEQQQIIHDHPEGCGFWAQLFEYTGLRVSEANALQWKDVDFAAGCIHVRGAMPWDYNNAYFETPKSRNGYRDVPILSPFRPALLARAEGHEPTDYVMSGCAEPLTQSQYRARWVMYCPPDRPDGLLPVRDKKARRLHAPGFHSYAEGVPRHRHRAPVPPPVRLKPLLRTRAGHGGAKTDGSRRYHDHPPGLPAVPRRGGPQVYRPAERLRYR